MAWSEDRKASTLAILQVNDGNITQTVRDTGVPASTIRKWRDEGFSKIDETQEVVAKKCEAKRGTLADYLEEIAWKLADNLHEDSKKLERAGLSQTATSFGIIVDKMRLLRGESTSINEVRESELRADIQRKLSKIAARRAEA